MTVALIMFMAVLYAAHQGNYWMCAAAVAAIPVAMIWWRLPKDGR